jgi:hypothetical protein
MYLPGTLHAALPATPPATVPALPAGSDARPAGSGARRIARVDGPWPRRWTASARGEYLAWLDYSNPHGPINTGITAAVKRLEVRCVGDDPKVLPIVMPHSESWQRSTTVRFNADAGASCTFSLLQGFNMSDLAQFAHYTGLLSAPAAVAKPKAGDGAIRKATGKRHERPRALANGGITGPLNSARIGPLHIAPLAPQTESPAVGHRGAERSRSPQ